MRVELYDTRRTKFIAAHNSAVQCITLSSNGKLLATASGGRIHCCCGVWGAGRAGRVLGGGACGVPASDGAAASDAVGVKPGDGFSGNESEGGKWGLWQVGCWREIQLPVERLMPLPLYSAF